MDRDSNRSPPTSSDEPALVGDKVVLDHVWDRVGSPVAKRYARRQDVCSRRFSDQTIVDSDLNENIIL